MTKLQKVNRVTTKSQGGLTGVGGVFENPASQAYIQGGRTERKHCECRESLQEEIPQSRGMAG